MKRLDPQFIEDRALRDAAKEVFMADIAHARVSLSGKGLAERVGGRIGDGAKDVFEVAKTNADDNRGIIATLIGAIVLWLTRGPILEAFGLRAADDCSDDVASTDLGKDESELEEAEISDPPDPPYLSRGETHD